MYAVLQAGFYCIGGIFLSTATTYAGTERQRKTALEAQMSAFYRQDIGPLSKRVATGLFVALSLAVRAVFILALFWGSPV
jgi:hypothetical protein